jgi:mitochondrial import receptor subunit TOM40
MGMTYSKADAATAPPPMPSFADLSKAAADSIKEKELAERPNYLDLPPPLKYEDIQRETLMALKPEIFEGMRFEITKPLNQNFFLSHSLFMGNMELGSGGRQMLKAPIGTYEFGANVISERFMMLGRIATDGRLSGRLKYDVLDWLGVKLHMQLSNEAGQSQVMVDSDVKGHDWNAQLKLGSPSFVGLNYFQSVTPSLSAGGEFFWLQSSLKSGVGLALRHTGEKHVGTMQLATTGIMSMGYAHKVRAVCRLRFMGKAGVQRVGASRSERLCSDLRPPSFSPLPPSCRAGFREDHFGL